MLRTALMAIALTAVGATAFAGDDDDYRRHDRGNKHYSQYDRDYDRHYDRHDRRAHYRKHHKKQHRQVYYVPAPPVYYRPPPRVYYPGHSYYPAPVYGYGGQPSLGIQLYIPLK